MAFRYRLLSTEGDDLGPFVSGHDRWKAGDALPPTGRADLRVTAVVAPEDGATFAGYLVIEAVTPT